MKEYDIKILETLEKTVTVQAPSREAAQEQVQQAYYNSEHILDSENFTGVQFEPQAEREIQQELEPKLDVLLVKPGMYPQQVQIEPGWKACKLRWAATFRPCTPFRSRWSSSPTRRAS